MSFDPIGIVAAIQERRSALEASLVRASPAARARALRKPPVYVQPQETRITVDCRTGVRTVERLGEQSKKVARQEVVARPPELPPQPKQVTAKQIVFVVEKAFGVGRYTILSGSRVQPISWARFAACRLIRELLDFSYPAIAQYVGVSDHTSIIHAMRRSDFFLEQNGDWARRYRLALLALSQRE